MQEPLSFVQIEAASGAGDAVVFCGGLLAVLSAAGVDLSSAEERCPGILATQYNLDAALKVQAVQLDLAGYEDVKATLTNLKRLKLKLVGKEGLIPEPTLAAFRYAL